jgi:hypothetical protein
MSQPILEMKAGYSVKGDSYKIYADNPQQIRNILVCNYPTIKHVGFYPNCELSDEYCTAVFHIKWKNTNQ